MEETKVNQISDSKLDGVPLRKDLFDDYDYKNKYLEKETKKQRKIREISKEYGDSAWKIRFHSLDEEGQVKYAQMKRERVVTTTYWSVIGSLVGYTASSSMTRSKRYLRAKSASKQVSLMLTAFFVPLGLLTYYGYAVARQEFVRGKMKLIQENSEGIEKEI